MRNTERGNCFLILIIDDAACLVTNIFYKEVTLFFNQMQKEISFIQKNSKSSHSVRNGTKNISKLHYTIAYDSHFRKFFEIVQIVKTTSPKRQKLGEKIQFIKKK